MGNKKDEGWVFPRRKFLKGMRWAPVVFLPARLHASVFHRILAERTGATADALAFADFRLTPHYPSKSPLEDVLRKVDPGADEYATEKYAFEIAGLLEEWSRGLRSSPPALGVLGEFVDASMESASMVPSQETVVRSGNGIEVRRRGFAKSVLRGRERFLQEIKTYFASVVRVETAEFEIVEIEEVGGDTQTVQLQIRYDLAGVRRDGGREERIGHWRTRWVRRELEGWKAVQWEATEETVSQAPGPIFVDVTKLALGQTKSYREQLAHGVDHWRTVLDGACGIDVYGNNGVAAGDFDNDGLDDFYVCQPSGLPNRLYRNRGDGTFEDVTEKSGVGVLDATACAIFADFENKGLQDLLVVCGGGPLLFLNQGNGKFSLKRDAFQFEKAPQGTFTHAAVADYDGDGRLDIYFCVYTYYLGLDQYRYPAPYFDARNGPPNFLLHNEGNASFVDRTEAAGLNADNDRYSFACAWGDYDSNGRQDLYVANDFGRNNLYRNNGDGTFSVASSEAGVEDPGAGMSACWLDYDNDGKQDIYVSNMWSAAGLRVSGQKNFHASQPEDIRGQYRRHAGGNSLYRNLGNGKFQNVSVAAGVAMGRWAWSSDSWDFDHDGYADLYIANGYISGPGAVGRERNDLSSFFWRQVVGKSPENSSPAPNYEHGWSAINELIRSDFSWNDYERNVLYSNNHDGTFSDVSGVAGLDFPDDSRSFALADINQDGRLEVILKNRNAPQIRILQNAMKDIGNAVVIRLQGQQSNRDAIGAAVTVEMASHRQTKYLQAGSGFLSQHSKELFFGLGQSEESIRATVRWPSGLTQSFERLPVNNRIEFLEGSKSYGAKPFVVSPVSNARTSEQNKAEILASSVETWLIEPLSAPDFALPDLAGATRELRSFRGGFLLLHFWATASPVCAEQLQILVKNEANFSSKGLRIVGINVDDSSDVEKVKSFAAKEGITFPTLLATQEMAGIYNTIYRYMFDRRRDLGLPTSFLVDKDGMIVKLYQGTLNAVHLMEDLRTVPNSAAERVQRALPFRGVLYQGSFQRNEFTYGVALFQRGYLEQAAASFQQVIAIDPENPEAHYNLGTLNLRRNSLSEARKYLEQTVKLRPNYPEAWNNLGMIAAQEGKSEEAVRDFQQSLSQRPTYSTALLNLGNLYRREGKLQEAEPLLKRALEISPEDPEANYNMGMLYVRREQFENARQYLQKAVSLRADYPEAINNLGVLFVRRGQNVDAEEQFKTCIRVAPAFDQAYLNLARLYVVMDEKEKARNILQELLRLQPEHKLGRQALEMLH